MAPVRLRWLILAAAVLVAGVATEALTERSVLLPALAVVADWLARPIRTPVGLLIALPLLGAWLYAFRSWRKSLPRLEHYTRDKIGGVIWEWAWESGAPSPHLDPICPRCYGPMRVDVDPATIDLDKPPADRASCACGFEQTIGIGGNYMSDLFRVEVDRRVRIGYWQEALEAWGRRGQPIPSVRLQPTSRSTAPQLDTS